MDALDDELLAQARSTLERVAAVERDLEVAKADVRHAVRRLQLSGGSVRSIGKALGMSHQRVQQLVESIDDGRGWKRRGRSAKHLVCSFCHRDEHDVAKLIAGPAVHICDGCVALARAAADDGKPAGWSIVDHGCSFCGKRASDAARHGDVHICRDCLVLCEEILATER